MPHLSTSALEHERERSVRRQARPDGLLNALNAAVRRHPVADEAPWRAQRRARCAVPLKQRLADGAHDIATPHARLLRLAPAGRHDGVAPIPRRGGELQPPHSCATGQLDHEHRRGLHEHAAQAQLRALQPPGLAAEHAHRLALYIAQTLSAGILLLPWWRRGFLRLPARVRPVLVLWVGVPFAIHALFHAELGYLLAYAAAPMLVGAAAPKAMVAAATGMSAALFLLPAPLDAARDSRPSGLGVNTPGDAAAVEVSFLVAPSRRGLANTASANRVFTRLLAPRAGPGTTIVCDRRWNETVAEQLLPGVRATWRDAPKLLVPAEGARILFVGWDDPGSGWRRLEQDGLVAWSRDIAPSDVPFTFRGLEAVRVD